MDETTITRVKEMLEALRVNLQNDGGDLELVKIEDKTVFLKLKGACGACPYAMMTLKGGIERIVVSTNNNEAEGFMTDSLARVFFGKTYQPKKITAVAFALALELSLDETKDFLGRAGYALSPSSRFDLIIEYFIENEVFDIYQINLALFDHEQECLGE